MTREATIAFNAKRAANFERVTIEKQMGATYCRNTLAVYGHKVYDHDSVLAGQPQRTFLDGGYTTIQEAVAYWPMAEVIDDTTYIDIEKMTAHLPDDDADDFDIPNE